MSYAACVKHPENMSEANNQASPTVEEMESCLRVLRWLRDGNIGLDESWTLPLTHVAGCVRGCIEIAKSERAGGRKPTASKTKSDKHVEHQRLVSLRGWTFTTWKSKDKSNEEWQGVGRKNGNVEIVTNEYYWPRELAIEAAKRAAEYREKQANGRDQ